MSREILTEKVTCNKCGFSIIIDITQLGDGFDRITRYIEARGWTGKWEHEPETWWSKEHSHRVGDICPDCSPKNQT